MATIGRRVNLNNFWNPSEKNPHQNQTPKMDLKAEIKMKSVYILVIKIEQLKLIFFSLNAKKVCKLKFY